MIHSIKQIQDNPPPNGLGVVVLLFVGFGAFTLLQRNAKKR